MSQQRCLHLVGELIIPITPCRGRSRVWSLEGLEPFDQCYTFAQLHWHRRETFHYNIYQIYHLHIAQINGSFDKGFVQSRYSGVKCLIFNRRSLKKFLCVAINIDNKTYFRSHQRHCQISSKTLSVGARPAASSELGSMDSLHSSL